MAQTTNNNVTQADHSHYVWRHSKSKNSRVCFPINESSQGSWLLKII